MYRKQKQQDMAAEEFELAFGGDFFSNPYLMNLHLNF
jgi:hypothetical protein